MGNEDDKPIFWKWQTHFRISAEVAAKSLFDKLDPALTPQFVLVGIAGDARSAPVLMIEADDEDWLPLDPKAFALRYVDHRENDEERNTLYGDEEATKRHQAWLPMLALQRALLDLVRAGPLGKAWVFYARGAIRVGGAAVVPLLALRKNVVDAYPALTKNTVWGIFRAPTSLIDAAAHEFLGKCERALHDEESWRFDLDAEDELRRAGDQLMYVPSDRGGDRGAFHGLFTTINSISALNYEGAPAAGRMIIAPPGHGAVRVCVQFVKPVSLRQYRTSRKLLEMSSATTAVLADNANAYGLGEVEGYDGTTEDLFEVRFISHYRWEFRHRDDILMRVAYGLPALPQPKLAKSRFQSLLKRVLGKLEPDALDRLWNLTNAASDQRRGALLVISADAASEAARLAGQGMPIAPARLTADLIQLGTSIDGAILLDPAGVCHAVGVILDGLATAKGSPGRGARYNSAVRYVETSRSPTVAIVFSEDGTIDLLPALRPQISRAELNAQLGSLRELASSSSDDVRRFHRLADWFNANRFYLSASECQEVNALRKQIDERIIAKRPGSIHIVYEDLAPNPDMNDSFFEEQ